MRRLFAIIVAAIALVGCSKDNITESYQTDQNDIYYASFEEFGDKSRTYVDEDVKLLWHEDDRISLFRTTLNEQFKFTGATGANSGGFAAVPSDEWVTGNQVSTNYAVYPYDATTRLSNAEIIQLTMPAVQYYAENSFGRGANTMVAAAENISSKFLPFRNLGGYIIVKLYGEDTTIKSIEFKGNNDEIIAGAATAEAKYGYLPVVSMSESGTTTITLDCGEEGVTISSDSANPTSFWFVVPPITFEGGFTFTITDINGNTFTKSTTKSQTVVRNEVKSMSGFEPTFEGEGEDPEVAPKPANNEIWYTATKKISPDDKWVFGAYLESNEWDSETGKGVITFDGDVTTIGYKAFSYKSYLTSITVPNSVTSIGGYAFRGCSSLTSVTIPESVISIGEDAFYGCTSLKSYTLMGATLFSNIYISDSVTSIYVYDEFVDVYKQQCPDWADKIIPMGSCDSETIIYYDNGGTLLNLQYYGAVVKEHIPGKLVLFGRGYSFEAAFARQTSLINVTFGNGVTWIGDHAFNGCTSLTSVTIPESVTSIGSYAFRGCSSLTSVTIPESITKIGGEAFEGCTSLTSVSIPGSVRLIGDGAFCYCPNLTSVAFGDGVEGIGRYAFEGCTSLISVTIPESVTTIGENAFYGCTSLTSVYCKAATPPYLDWEVTAFVNNASGRKIYVPRASVNAYKNDEDWSQYADAIVGYDF